MYSLVLIVYCLADESPAAKEKDGKLESTAKPSLGEMFKPKAGQWECQVVKSYNLFATRKLYATQISQP